MACIAPVVTDTDALQDLDDDVRAVVVARKLLIQPPSEAVADAKGVAQALLEKGAKQLYYKYSALFSSTARGNIGPVSEALMKLTGADHVLFCPARPENNATVYQGRLFLKSGMLHESARRNDPVTPMTNSNLVEVLQSQSQVKVGLLRYQTLREGRDASKHYIAEQVALGVRFFIVDAINPEDMTSIARLARDTPLVTGSDDLPVALAEGWSPSQTGNEPRTLLPPAPGHLALISGSCTPKSLRQLELFEREYPVFRIDLRQISESDTLIDEVMAWAQDRVTLGPIGVATTTTLDEVQRVHAKVGREGATALADHMLGNFARRFYDLGVRKFLVAGGETSGTVMDSLGVDRVDVAIHDELQGSYCHRAGDVPLALMLKAGNTGGEDFYDNAIDRLRRADEVTN